MAVLRCGKCNFQFKREKIPILCPFCGTENAVYEEGDASALLNDIDSMLE